MSEPLATQVIAAARALGFDRAAIVPLPDGSAAEPRRLAFYRSWLAADHAAGMHYLATTDHVAGRGDLRTLLATARSLIVVALAYQRTDPAVVPIDRLRGRIARYARGIDYHLVMRDRLVALADRIADLIGRPIAARPCVDSAAVLERDWAERAGLGFIAKNTMLIAPGLGSYVVLGELVVDVELTAAAPIELAPRCGSCRACLDACPTGAFVDSYLLDARRCISYLTIEHHGAIPRPLRKPIGTSIFGCDICQEVCPFNAGGHADDNRALAPRTLDHALPDLVALAALNTNQLRQFVKRTALRRVPRDVLRRNIAVALANTGDPRAIAPLRQLARDRSPLVRGHAAWGLAELGALDLALFGDETDPSVVAELTAADQS